MHFIDPDDDTWRHTDALASPRPGVLHDLGLWRAARHGWPAAVPTGVVLDNTDDVLELAPDLHRLALVALQFPKWTDGRAYSQARLLRVRAKYRGEIRALGDVTVDMAPLLARTGFSSARLRDGQSTDVARRTLRFIDTYYQGDVRSAGALFHREAA